MSMKCILVSTSCEKLKEFINKNSGGSVDIIECMESVYPNKSTLSNKLIRANKFIYVIYDKMFFKGGSFRNAKHEKPEFTKRK